MTPSTPTSKVEPSYKERYSSVAKALADPNCPERLLLDLPIRGWMAYADFLTFANPTPAVLDRAVDIVCQDALSRRTRRYRDIQMLLKAQPKLTPQHLRRLMRATVDYPVPEGDADWVVGAFLDHPARGSDTDVAELLQLPLRPCDATGRGAATRPVVLRALRRRRHPLAAVLDLWARANSGRMFGLSELATGLDDLDRWARETGTDRPTVAATMLRLGESWHGTGEELVASALAILSR